MKEIVKLLKKKWQEEDVLMPSSVIDSDIKEFELSEKVVMPIALSLYFKELNGTMEKCDNKLFEFYSLDNFKSIKDMYSDWNGIPEYQLIFEKLEEIDNYYVLCNYLINSFSYAIYLNDKESINRVIVFCGGEYKEIANSFQEFILLYLNDAEKLYF